jgi:hypothetical protein
MFKKQKIRNMGLLIILYELFKLAKIKGNLALESHCERPLESKYFPKEILSKKEIEFLSDYIRELTLGTSDSNELDRMISNDINNRTFFNPFHKQRLNAIKEAFFGHTSGYAPLISVEFARKSFHFWVRPNFIECEEIITNELDCFLETYYGVDIDARNKELKKLDNLRFNGLLALDEEFDNFDTDEPNTNDSNEPTMKDILSSIRKLLIKDETEIKNANTIIEEKELIEEWSRLSSEKDNE